MSPRTIRWKRGTTHEAKAACNDWLRAQGYGVTVLFGDLWMIGRGWR